MSEDVIDLPDFLDRVQDDKDLLLELLDIYMSDFEVKRNGLKQAVARKNFEEIKSIAHSLKGSSGNISAKFLRVTFLKFEEMGKAQTLADADKLLAEMDKQYSDLVLRINVLKKELKG